MKYGALALFEHFDGSFESFTRREEHRKYYGFVVVTPELVAALKPHCTGTIVEVMAGTGYLAAALRAAGVQLRATDDMSWHPKMDWGTHTPVDRMDAALAARDADTVIMAWPYMDDAAFRTAKAMKPGAALIYCGEGSGGCTANDDFFELMSTWHRDEKFEADVQPHHKQWYGLHDEWSMYVKPVKEYVA